MRATSGNLFGKVRSLACASLFTGLAVLAACSTDRQIVVVPAPPCDSTKCAAGNTCLALDGVTKCRKTCASNDDPATSCPFGYTCTDTRPGEEVSPFCVQDRAVRADGAPLVKKERGQWGALCRANLGVESEDCDTAQGFYCYGTTPTDGEAYCTRYDCVEDAECGAGFWCGKINQTPNVMTAKRLTIGETQNVCLRRTYCSTCTSDIDCPAVAGRPQHCIADSAGAQFCSPECEATTNCPLEARCATVTSGAGSVKVCYPRATVCVGDGSLCTPCRVDTDCGDDGACVKGEYTTERFCAKKVTACTECPKTVAEPKRTVGCSSKGSERLPMNHCVGLYAIKGTVGADIGCWTPDR